MHVFHKKDPKMIVMWLLDIDICNLDGLKREFQRKDNRRHPSPGYEKEGGKIWLNYVKNVARIGCRLTILLGTGG
jgi:hypothetical protein